MADEPKSREGGQPLHRGRVQAQGGGTEESEPWAEPAPPTAGDVLRTIDVLEARLTPKERREREQPFADLRRYVRNAAAAGGISASDRPVKKSFLKRGSRDVRVDLEVLKGSACVPDPERAGPAEGGE